MDEEARIVPFAPTEGNLAKVEQTGENNMYMANYGDVHLHIQSLMAESAFAGGTYSDKRIVQELINRFWPKKLKRKEKPPEIASEERPFMRELWKVYTQCEGRKVERKSDLSDYYQDDLEMRRDDFYAAETVHIEGSSVLGSNGPETFKELKEEVLSNVKRAYITGRNLSGFDRMEKVMERAEALPCEKTIFSMTDWVGAEERRGICHMLAGDKKLPWVNENE